MFITWMTCCVVMILLGIGAAALLWRVKWQAALLLGLAALFGGSLLICQEIRFQHLFRQAEAAQVILAEARDSVGEFRKRFDEAEGRMNEALDEMDEFRERADAAERQLAEVQDTIDRALQRLRSFGIRVDENEAD
ncbi:hypothetical protein ACFL26_00810 [Patescibacteria group bacterium]